MPEIRKPSAAGRRGFYPDNAVELTKRLAGFFSEVDKTPITGRPLALIAPHAGYDYSGKTAARAFKLLEGESYDSVVVVSPSHTVFFKGAAVFEGDGYETPLGVVNTDHDLSKKIASINRLVYFSQNGHATGSTRGEHALEVMLPFLQVALGDFKLVAIVMGDQEEDTVNGLGEVLAAALKGTNTLLVASTDLSHFHNEKTARNLDGAVQRAIEQYDPKALLDVLGTGRGEACGGGPVAAVLTACKRLCGEKVQSLGYTTSGETTGYFDEVVGYYSAVVTASGSAMPARPNIGERPARRTRPESISAEDQRILLQIARDSIRARLVNNKYTPPESESLSVPRGAFVTLKIDGELRGCIGQIRATQAVGNAVADMAVAAAFEDPRFVPVQEDEYDQLQFEISVLSPLTRVKDFDDIEVGRDGLMVKLDYHSGLLLPQVATENKWNVIQFLEQTCLKAGLPKNSYRDKYAEVYKFSAEIF